MTNIYIPPYADILFKPMRYKILYGGRGGGKSWAVANSLLIQGLKEKKRILCAREFQNSIDASVLSLLGDQIQNNNLGYYYEVGRGYVRGRNGTEFGFEGLARNPGTLKSWEGADICWVEEAALVSEKSWDILIPTIRKPGSEIWATFNPDLDTDDTYKRFILNKRSDAYVVKVSYKDNPFISQEALAEMEHCKQSDFDKYLNIWEGHCKQSVEGAVYAKEIRELISENRVCAVPYERSNPVHTFWDIGYADYTAVWFVQYSGFEIHVIDYYQDRLQSDDFYLKMLKEKGYLYGTAYLPHDAKNKNQYNKGISFEMKLNKAGFKAEALKHAERKIIQIQAVRDVFPKCYFDEANTKLGVEALRRYKYKVNEMGQYSREPDHDEFSHGADAFAQMAVRLKKDKKRSNVSSSYSTEFNL